MTGFYATGEVATGSTAATVTDTTAPTLTAASATATGATTATGSVTTNESGGTLYWLVNTSATATAAQVKAGSSKAVITAGAQTVSVASLAASTLYYLHFLHADGAATPNESTVANSASFTTQAAASTVTSVTVTPSTATLAGGATVDFDWIINGTNSPSQAATVTTSLGTINSAGVLTAPAATSSSQSGTVTVTSTQDTTKSGTATFTVAALAGDTTGPVMQGVIATSKTSTTTSISWDPATDASGVGEYFYRKDGGALVSTGLSRTASFTGLAPLTPHLYEVTANDIYGNPSGNSISVTVVTDAASTDPTLVDKSIVVTLKNRSLALQASVGGINWTWSDARGTVTSSGTGLMASSAGVLTVPIKTRLLTDAKGFLTLDNYNGGNPLTYFGTAAWVRVP